MKKTLIAGAIMALVSSAVSSGELTLGPDDKTMRQRATFAGSPSTNPDSSVPSEIQALEQRIDDLNIRTQQLEIALSDSQQQAGLLARIEKLEANVEKIEVPYTVYDQTGRAVGTTYDGVVVYAEIDGLSYRFTVGQEIDPDYSTGDATLHFSRNCTGEPYLQAPSTVSPPPVERMDGVEIEDDNGPTQGVVVKNANGGYLTRDLNAAPIKWVSTSASILIEGECLLGDAYGYVELQVLPLVPWYIDWVAPLTITPPQ